MRNDDINFNKVHITVIGIGANVCKLWEDFTLLEEYREFTDISFIPVKHLMNSETMIQLPIILSQKSDLLFVLANNKDKQSIELAAKCALKYKMESPNGIASYITTKEYLSCVWPDNLRNCFDNFIFVETVHQIYKPIETITSGCCPGFIGVDYVDISETLISSKQFIFMQESCSEGFDLPAMTDRFCEKISDFQKDHRNAERTGILQISVDSSRCEAINHLKIAETVLSLFDDSSSLRMNKVVPIGIFSEQQQDAVQISALVSI